MYQGVYYGIQEITFTSGSCRCISDSSYDSGCIFYFTGTCRRNLIFTDESSATDEDVEAVVAQTAKENYTGLCIAQVNDYVNVRSEASEEGEIVGKLFNNSVGDVEDPKTVGI